MAAKRTRSPARGIERLIFEVRGQRVLLDEHLAELYGVTTRELNQSVTRNRRRFPEDFAFRLSALEWAALRSQNVISNESRGGRRYPPRAFTEEGVAMLSSVLRSDRAVDVNVAIMRAFVQVRRLASGNADLLRRLDALERRVGTQDVKFQAVFKAIRKLVQGPSGPQTKRIGLAED